MEIYETWFGIKSSWPAHVLLFIGQIRQGMDPGRGKNRPNRNPLHKRRDIVIFVILVLFRSQIFDSNATYYLNSSFLFYFGSNAVRFCRIAKQFRVIML